LLTKNETIDKNAPLVPILLKYNNFGYYVFNKFESNNPIVSHFSVFIQSSDQLKFQFNFDDFITDNNYILEKTFDLDRRRPRSDTFEDFSNNISDMESEIHSKYKKQLTESLTKISSIEFKLESKQREYLINVNENLTLQDKVKELQAKVWDYEQKLSNMK